jgi:hypothetical protein
MILQDIARGVMDRGDNGDNKLLQNFVTYIKIFMLKQSRRLGC